MSSEMGKRRRFQIESASKASVQLLLKLDFLSVVHVSRFVKILATAMVSQWGSWSVTF